MEFAANLAYLPSLLANHQGTRQTGLWVTLCVMPGCLNTQISAERWGTAMEVEVAIVVHGVFPLPLGIEREDRCE